MPLAIISAIVRRSSSVTPGLAAGGYRTMDVRLAGRADGDPAHPVVADVGADLETEGVAIEGEGGVGIVLGQEARVNRDVHGAQSRCGPGPDASRFLTGLVTCLATQAGIPAVASAACWR